MSWGGILLRLLLAVGPSGLLPTCTPSCIALMHVMKHIPHGFQSSDAPRLGLYEYARESLDHRYCWNIIIAGRSLGHRWAIAGLSRLDSTDLFYPFLLSSRTMPSSNSASGSASSRQRVNREERSTLDQRVDVITTDLQN